MPKYLIERRFHVAEEEMPEVNRRSKEIIPDRREAASACGELRGRPS
jgi:hypothetical protein